MPYNSNGTFRPSKVTKAERGSTVERAAADLVIENGRVTKCRDCNPDDLTVAYSHVGVTGKFLKETNVPKLGDRRDRRSTDKARWGRRATDNQGVGGALPGIYAPSTRRPIAFDNDNDRPWGSAGTPLKSQVAALKQAREQENWAAAEKRVLETAKPKPVYSPTGSYQKDEATFGPGDIVEWAHSTSTGARFLVLGGYVDEAVQKQYPYRTGNKVRFTDGLKTWTTEPTRLTPVGWLKR